jgi:hypothetical protein
MSHRISGNIEDVSEELGKKLGISKWEKDGKKTYGKKSVNTKFGKMLYAVTLKPITPDGGMCSLQCELFDVPSQSEVAQALHDTVDKQEIDNIVKKSQYSSNLVVALGIQDSVISRVEKKITDTVKLVEKALRKSKKSSISSAKIQRMANRIAKDILGGSRVSSMSSVMVSEGICDLIMGVKTGSKNIIRYTAGLNLGVVDESTGNTLNEIRSAIVRGLKESAKGVFNNELRDKIADLVVGIIATGDTSEVQGLMTKTVAALKNSEINADNSEQFYRDMTVALDKYLKNVI